MNKLNVVISALLILLVWSCAKENFTTPEQDSIAKTQKELSQEQVPDNSEREHTLDLAELQLIYESINDFEKTSIENNPSLILPLTAAKYLWIKENAETINQDKVNAFIESYSSLSPEQILKKLTEQNSITEIQLDFLGATTEKLQDFSDKDDQSNYLQRMLDQLANNADLNVFGDITMTQIVQTALVQYGVVKNPVQGATNRDHECQECIDDCLEVFLFSNVYWNIFWDNYDWCRQFGGTHNDCVFQSHLWAESIVLSEICIPECEEECEPEPCTDCPPGYVYDGANCYSGIHAPPGYEGFVYNNAFYVEPNCCTVCPSGSKFDGANCYFGLHFPEGYDGFIYNNAFYVERNCSISTANDCCPSGFSFDGANCYSGVHFPEGYDGFIYNNSFYVVPQCDYSNREDCCPEGWPYDGANCYSGIHHPEGWEAFVWNGGFYLKARCL